MITYIFDSYAFLAFFKKEPGCEVVNKLLHKCTGDRFEGLISSINLGEVYYMLCRKFKPDRAALGIKAIYEMPVRILAPSIEDCLTAAKLKAKYKISYADAFAASLAIHHDGILITGDKEFESLHQVPGFKVIFLNK